ncbi:hypothetical protein MKQ68_06910 [Chitinophaga horti]|uniref:Uncharacterized protein n=1 Tax=Chitinophaga horti TaxID=2920382 RepID=A0ABY6J565_9BACT|nr:hypothetical protein [Chitinophaga horti]UYQ94820.1 hypothetical protein MKQ68_06910 [Chitinophaga horti]
MDPKALLPYWAAFFSQREYMRFLSVIDNYFRQREVLYTLNYRELKIQGEPTRFAMLVLEELAHQCRQQPETEWPDLVRARLSLLHDSAAFEQDFADKAAAYDYARNYLALRLYPADYIAHFDKDQLLGHAVRNDLYAMLVFDLGGVLKNVDPLWLMKWEVRLDAVLQAALKNMRQRERAADIVLSNSLPPAQQTQDWQMLFAAKD